MTKPVKERVNHWLAVNRHNQSCISFPLFSWCVCVCVRMGACTCQCESVCAVAHVCVCIRRCVSVRRRARMCVCVCVCERERERESERESSVICGFYGTGTVPRPQTTWLCCSAYSSFITLSASTDGDFTCCTCTPGHCQPEHACNTYRSRGFLIPQHQHTCRQVSVIFLPLRDRTAEEDEEILLWVQGFATTHRRSAVVNALLPIAAPSALTYHTE